MRHQSLVKESRYTAGAYMTHYGKQQGIKYCDEKKVHHREIGQQQQFEYDAEYSESRFHGMHPIIKLTMC